MKNNSINGKGRGSYILLSYLFFMQEAYQHIVTGEQELPIESPKWYEYHIKGMIEGLGKLMKSDKRWKTHRNEAYDRDNKLEEIADIFIEVMNLAMFSGIGAEELSVAVIEKISENMRKFAECNLSQDS